MARTYTKVNWQDGTVLQPAKVTIDGTDYNVDPAVESGTTPVNATNLDKMDTAISNAVTDINNLETVKIEQSAIELLEVTDTAPEHCSEGDMYYNTTTNLIYTATGTDTWGTTGEIPSSDYLYIDLTNQQLYYYDGTNFNSYGGGGGSTEVYIQDTEPTEEDAKIWIDTGEVQNRGSELPMVYPVGSIYMSVNNTNPATLFGFGTWEQIKDTFLLSAGSTYTAGNTGGSATHTLTEQEMPSHNHRLLNGYSGGTWSTGYYGVVANTGTNGEKHVFYDNDTSRTSSAGGGQAFSTMPPYLVVYMWKRIA